MLLEMKQDQSIVFLTADLGFNALEPIKAEFGDRFFNVGVAEATMIGVAAGLALEGKKVIAYSIASFASMRPFEQIRDDVCYHDLNVKVVGTGGGFNYPHHGVTHHTVEDVAIMRALPNMTVVCPAYSWEAREATKAIIKHQGPVYMRLGKNPSQDFSKSNFSFKLGRGFVVKEGRDIVLISTGNVLDLALETAKRLERQKIGSVKVISMPSVKPLDEKMILESVGNAKAVFTIEEHSVIGGLGSAVASLLVTPRVQKKIFHMFGFPDSFIRSVGDREYLLKKAGLYVDAIAKKIIMAMSSSPQ